MNESPGRLLLRQARVFVARSWCRGADARDSAGAPVDPWDERAASWSLLGAIVAVLEREAAETAELPLEHLAAALGGLAEVIDCDSLASWNDDPARTQDAVLCALSRAEAECDRVWSELRIATG